MSSHRTLTFLARLVLAWFVLHVGVGIAAPVIQPHTVQLICAGGMLKVVLDGGEQSQAAASVDCPLCSPALAPPPAAKPAGRISTPPAAVAQHATGVTPRVTEAPPPARGPPAPTHA
jgi:hypothetical protein